MFLAKSVLIKGVWDSDERKKKRDLLNFVSLIWLKKKWRNHF